MAPVKFLSLASASLLLLDWGAGVLAVSRKSNQQSHSNNAPKQTVVTVMNFGKESQCMREVNMARQKAGLTNLVGLPEGSWTPPSSTGKGTNSKWEPLCEYLEKLAEGGSKEDVMLSGQSYAFMDLGDATTANCTQAVDHWKNTLKNLYQVPPKYSSTADLYKRQSTLNLLTLYNPSPQAAGDCRVATCTKSETTGGSRGTPLAVAAVSKHSALLCVTSPNVFVDDSAPFTKEQWTRISTSIKSAQSAAMPSTLVIVAAAIGVSLF